MRSVSSAYSYVMHCLHNFRECFLSSLTFFHNLCEFPVYTLIRKSPRWCVFIHIHGVTLSLQAILVCLNARTLQPDERHTGSKKQNKHAHSYFGVFWTPQYDLWQCYIQYWNMHETDLENIDDYIPPGSQKTPEPRMRVNIFQVSVFLLRVYDRVTNDTGGY